ncbi:leucine-rich repeat-containing protein [Desulfurispirillum indicum S5]|uniref:Leucine-rich repeat-containing protein n=1 Tax=Desulfurispirillum indicum (strain ATCC BAA-1389 / DSM 22839 / S5) TaxID=653733 RepID=E6W2V3_DESIS|nr:leucine-rich repeat domain-containing protein [Desulfurispirillum indicum]ADU66778.1 leucine-rich repeat-containing protein [Desulfurispirillum indicum S5]
MPNRYREFVAGKALLLFLFLTLNAQTALAAFNLGGLETYHPGAVGFPTPESRLQWGSTYEITWDTSRLTGENIWIYMIADAYWGQGEDQLLRDLEDHPSHGYDPGNPGGEDALQILEGFSIGELVYPQPPNTGSYRFTPIPYYYQEGLAQKLLLYDSEDNWAMSAGVFMVVPPLPDIREYGVHTFRSEFDGHTPVALWNTTLFMGQYEVDEITEVTTLSIGRMDLEDVAEPGALEPVYTFDCADPSCEYESFSLRSLELVDDLLLASVRYTNYGTSEEEVRLLLFDAADPTVLPYEWLLDSSGFNDGTLALSGNLLAVITRQGSDSRVQLLEVGSGPQITPVSTIIFPGEYLHSLSFSADGSLLAIGSLGNRFFLYDVSNPAEPDLLVTEELGSHNQVTVRFGGSSWLVVMYDIYDGMEGSTYYVRLYDTGDPDAIIARDTLELSAGASSVSLDLAGDRLFTMHSQEEFFFDDDGDSQKREYALLSVYAYDQGQLLKLGGQAYTPSTSYVDVDGLSVVANANRQMVFMSLSREGNSFLRLYATPAFSDPLPTSGVDTALLNSLRGALGKSDITMADVLSTRTLSLTGVEISDLNGLQHFVNLQELNLRGNLNVSDLQPLTYLNQLQWLSLGGSSVDDLSALAALPGLETLAVWGTGLTALDIGGMTHLKNLYASHGEIADVTSLPSGLEELYLDGNNLEDLDFLTGLPLLRVLYLGNNQISDLAPVSGRGGLEVLQISGNAIDDLSPLSTLTNLQELYASENDIADMAPLVGLSHLRVLDLWGNQIVSLPADLSGLSSLETLNLGNNQLTDIDGLAALSTLSILHLDSNQISDASALVPLAPPLQWLNLFNNPLSELSGASVDMLRLTGVTVVLTDTEGAGSSGRALVVDGDGQSSQSQCFIATAAYGSAHHFDVQILRQMRDRFLLTHPAGRWLVQEYYRLSPPVARAIDGSAGMMLATRLLLSPVVALAYGLVYWQQSLMVLLFGLLTLGYRWRRDQRVDAVLLSGRFS